MSDSEAAVAPSNTPENFIPWEQIEPLLRPGMNGHELAGLLLARVGLPSHAYGFVTVRSGETFAEALRGGVRLVKRPECEGHNDATLESAQ